MFVTFEGPEGGGKSTQAGLLARRLGEQGTECVLVHEPGGTDLGADVRALLVRRNWTAIHPWAEAMLFSACRAQLVAEIIRPALERGAVVVADRFADSTFAYQGAGRGLPLPQLQALIDIATQGLLPDITFLLDLPVEVGIARLQGSSKVGMGGPSSHLAGQLTFFEQMEMPEDWNRFEDEALGFHERVQAAYRELAGAEADRWVVIDATRSVVDIEAAVWEAVGSRQRRRGGSRQ